MNTIRQIVIFWGAVVMHTQLLHNVVRHRACAGVIQ